MSIEFILDGRTVTAEPGQTILEVATANGIKIPTLCRESRISKTTSCFVCVVRDRKTGRYMPSCAAVPAPGQEIEASSPEVLDMRKTALSLLLSEHTGDCEAPCTMACPAHANVEEYVRAGRKGEFLHSLQIIKKRIPLPMSIGRVCPRFCEKDCRRNVYGEPVAINDFKRLAADLYYDEYMEELPELTGKKVAIVGAGPADFPPRTICVSRGSNRRFSKPSRRPAACCVTAFPNTVCRRRRSTASSRIFRRWASSSNSAENSAKTFRSTS